MGLKLKKRKKANEKKRNESKSNNDSTKRVKAFSKLNSNG